MKFAVGVLTHDVYANVRVDLLEQTLSSMNRTRLPSALLLSNGSTDGTDEVARMLKGASYTPPDGNTKPGRGNNILVELLLGRGADVIVLSDDDMEWSPDAAAKLTTIWTHAPDDLVVVGGLLEPEYSWSTPRETIDCGGVNVLVRDSVPCAAWTFRARDWALFGPFLEDFGQDVDACRRLREKGYRVGQVDLAKHLGAGRSSWGNDLAHQYARPLDRERWGV